MTSKIEEKLQDHAYRTAFVASQINIGIPFQIKALMKTRGWTQEQLAERTGMLQPRISAVLKPGKVRPNIETLRRFAEAFDCGLLVRFAPFSELANWSDSFDPERFDVPAFEDEASLKESEMATIEEFKYAVVGSRLTSSSGFAAPNPAIQADLEFRETAGVQPETVNSPLAGKPVNSSDKVINSNVGRRHRGRGTGANKKSGTGSRTNADRGIRESFREQRTIRIDLMGFEVDVRTRGLSGQTDRAAYGNQYPLASG
jgi:transcriptional regulator with XRE-family HTH domain